MSTTAEMTRPKLLLADDSVTVRKVVELTFAEEGIEVISAADGDDAMQRFVEQTPSIVLVDVEMPGQNGYQICEMIKSDESTKDIPVLLLVGSFEPFDQTEAERVGADGFLTKPFHSIRELVSRVNELLTDAASGPGTSPDTADIEELYNESFAETVPLTDEVSEEDLGEPSFDDEIVETVQPDASYSENGIADSISTMETVQVTVKDFDWSPEAKVDAADAVPHYDAAIHDSKADTEEIVVPFPVPAPEPAPAEAAASFDGEISDELVSQIAKRVVEKLSDRVIRDIAQEAVPRIAEKLIREALEEEGKT